MNPLDYLDIHPKSNIRKIINFLLILGYVNIWLVIGIYWYLTKDKK